MRIVFYDCYSFFSVNLNTSYLQYNTYSTYRVVLVLISIDDKMIKRVDHTKSLGLTIDAQLSLSKHVDEICKKASLAIGVLKRVRPFISKGVAVQIYNALILPHFDYCSSVWDCMSGYLSDKLQKLQNRAARVITKLPFDTSSNLLLATLK